MNYIQMRESRKRGIAVSKIIADSEYDEDQKRALVLDANKICRLYNLSRQSTKETIILLLTNGVSESEISNRINFILDSMEKYGYSNANTLLERNIKLILHSTNDLMHTLAITNKYDLDKRFLISPSIYSRVTDKEIYSLIEELKENNIDVTYENIQNLYINVNNAGNLNKLNELHPLTNKEIFVNMVLYNQNMKNKVKTK